MNTLLFLVGEGESQAHLQCMKWTETVYNVIQGASRSFLRAYKAMTLDDLGLTMI